MAKFKISLIVPNNDNNFNSFLNEESETYIASVVTDYQDQKETYKQSSQLLNKHYNVAYTYNEKLSERTNGQKELSFSMDDKIFVNEQWIENPYARILRNGVQLELIDKHQNRKLFTINKISYSFNNISTTYNITCQDSFTYQLTRQNDGYVLKNDETSSDFIGALDIDQWAERISKDCYITYNYVPLDTGIYMDKDGVIKTYTFSGDDIENYVDSLPKDDILKIIKPIYNKDNYKSYYDTVVFSASGSSADAALIAVGELLGLQLNTVEGLVDNSGVLKYCRFFYFGPAKNPETTGLTYSPLRDIQDFNLSFSGDSLTTVLNVKSTTWNDEEIGLLPSLPVFFNQLFMSNDWKETEYYPGFFLAAVQGRELSNQTQELLISRDGTHIEIGGNQYQYFELKRAYISSWAIYYNKVKFYWPDKDYYTAISGASGIETITTPFQSNNLLKIGFFTKNPSNNTYYIYNQDEEIDSDVIASFNQGNLHCGIFVSTGFSGDAGYAENVFLILTREYTQEEIEYAQIVEQCPWLENKLMDFSYFVRQGVISKGEYEGLMSWLLNDLRIINGQLMCYAATYLQALHDQVQFIARLQQDLDALGASFEADVIRPFTTTGSINANISNFTTTYSNIFKNDNIDNQQPLINLNNIVSDTFNKYFSAEQRFLKNMYDFKKYFNAKNIYSLTNNTILQEVQYQVTSSSINILPSFTSTIHWTKLSNNSPIVETGEDGYYYLLDDIYTFKNNKHIKQKIPNHSNYKEFFVSIISSDTLNGVKPGHIYNPANKYFLTLDKFEDIFGSTTAADQTFKLNDIDYVLLSVHRVAQLFLYQQINSSNSNDYYIRDAEMKVPLEWVRCNADVIQQAISPLLWNGLSFLSLYNYSSTVQEVLKNEKWYDKLNKLQFKDFWQIYQALVPLDKVYIKDYSLIPNTEENQSWTILDKYGKPYTYKDDSFYDASDNEVSIDNLYKTYYALPFISFSQAEHSTVASASNDITVTYSALRFYLAIQGESPNKKYYSCYWDNTKYWISTAIGVFWRSKYASKWAEISQAIARGEQCLLTWGQRDKTEYTLATPSGSAASFKWTNHQNKDDHKNERLGQTTKFRSGIGHWANYTIGADDEIKIKQNTESWFKDTNTLRRQLEENSLNNYKHYATYYKYIAVVNSQGSITHDDDKDLIDNFDENYPIPLRTVAYDDFFINNKYATFCTKDTIINPQDTYVLCLAKLSWTKDGNTIDVPLIKFNSEGEPRVGTRFSTIKFYPIIGNKESINFNLVFKTNELSRQDYNLENYVDRMNSVEPGSSNYISSEWDEDCPYLLKITTYENGDAVATNACCILHLEPYEKRFIGNTTNSYRAGPHNLTISFLDISNTFYSSLTDKKIKVSEYVLEPVLDDFSNDCLFFIPEKDTELVKVSSLSTKEQEEYWSNDDTHWYTDNDFNTRTYTLEQIFNDDLQYYFLQNNQLKKTEFINADPTVKTPLIINLTTYGWDEDNAIVINQQTKKIENVFEFNDSSEASTATYEDLTITRTIIKDFQIGEMTNGEFWYWCHNYIDASDIVENALLIETQLTMHWQNAYSASQYCEWFIPERWQDTIETQVNKFSPMIWKVASDQKIILNNTLIPEVEIYNYENKTTLPNYTFYYDNEDGILEKKEMHHIEDIGYLKNNPAILNTMTSIFHDKESLEEILSHFTVQEYGKRTYYYRMGGGTLRKDILQVLDPTKDTYPHYSGLYNMQLDILLHKYCNAKTTEYQRLLDTKLAYWKALYTRYPGIFLEKTYENKDARSSTQLLQMAQLAFKDYTSPEKQYNITLIDAAALDGYEGQELHIGDGILIRTSDYYDAVDETYRALNQYLFISDIKYNLRDDSGISLTVNTIKYQDKLLQSIVKLIR